MLKKKNKPSLAPRLYIDSTMHEQSGKKVEGLAYNYKDQWGLDSQLIFDELGFCWDMELRAGSTKSGVGAVEQIKRVFLGYQFSDEKYLSADSAYCKQDVIKTCIGLGVSFTVTAHHGTTGWRDQISEITNWKKWGGAKLKKSDFGLSEEESLEVEKEVEVGSFHWRPSWNESLCFPVVVQRRKRKQPDLVDGAYKYYGLVTNMSLLDNSLEQVVHHHNQRGNAENFIKEGKYGFDLKHFRCQKLKANHGFGMLAMVAHNILRWVSRHDNPDQPKFSKYLRQKFLIIPGKLVSHGRQLTLRIPERFLKEVQRLRSLLRWEEETALVSGIP